MKLAGSLIYMDEALDEAAQRVLYELTGLKNVNLMQFKACLLYTSPAINATTGLVTLLRIYSAACSSAFPPISPIRTIAVSYTHLPFSLITLKFNRTIIS